MVTKTFCDLCHERKPYGKGGVLNTKESTNRGWEEHYDLCETCFAKVINLIKALKEDETLKHQIEKTGIDKLEEIIDDICIESYKRSNEVLRLVIEQLKKELRCLKTPA